MILRGWRSKRFIAVCVPALSILISTATIARVLRIMPLGDSITAGEHYGAPAFGERTGYRKCLYELLIADEYDVNFVGSLNWGFNAVPSFDCDHEGHPGWTASQIASNVYRWLEQNPPDIVLAHVGTNGLSVNNDKDVEHMLDEIDRYEMDHDVEITVFLARIVHRYGMESSATTTAFNDNIEAMALSRVRNQGDKIIIVDMESDAGIDYMADGVDMWGTTYPGVGHDLYHPSDKGNEKMAQLWFKYLQVVFAPHGANDPYPANGSYLWPATFQGFRWSMPTPRHSRDVVTCDVYIGTDPNAMEKIVVNEPTDCLATDVFPISVDTTYYWRVDCHDPNAGNAVVTGARVWTFHTFDPVPRVDAGRNLSCRVGLTVPMHATVTDEGDPNAVLYCLWSVESAPADSPEVVFDDRTMRNPSVTFFAVGEYILRLSVSDDGPVEDRKPKDVAGDVVAITVQPPARPRR